MLYLRIITAVCLIPLVIWGIFGLGQGAFALVSGGLFLLGAWEWTAIAGIISRPAKFAYCALFAVIISALFFIQHFCCTQILFLLNALLWLLPLYWVCRYRGDKTQYLFPYLLNNRCSKSVMGMFYLALPWLGLNSLHSLPQGAYWVIVLFLIVWSCDTFAYFIGRQWGKTPLIPFVSPNKTVIGLWGGIIGGSAVGLIGFAVLGHLTVMAVGIIIGTVLLAVLGDLFESLVKRLSQIKDSGTILPGHGGVLDRIDSLLSTLSFFTVCIIGLIK